MAQTANDSTSYAVRREAIGDAIDDVQVIDAQVATLLARKAERVAYAESLTVASAPMTQGRGWSPYVVEHRELVSEIAAALHIPERSAERLIAESKALTTTLPHTLESLRTGMISYRHAQVVFDHALSLPTEAHAAFEDDILPSAQTLTVTKFDSRARKRRERLHPESIEKRHAEAVGQRMVELSPARDGMAYLSAFLPADEAIAAYNRITDIATGLAKINGASLASGEPDGRSLGERRADVLTDLLCYGIANVDDETGGPLGQGITATIMVTVPALTMLGNSQEPAELEGYGPIDVKTAKKLVGTAKDFIRILTHPESGAVLSVGRERYKVPPDMRLWLRVRDGCCRFPGCGRAAKGCDTDHTHDWAKGGITSVGNLAHLCPKHHRLKHHTEW